LIAIRCAGTTPGWSGCRLPRRASRPRPPCALRPAAAGEGISPGPVEATVTITDNHGYFFGQLDLDAGDAQFMVNAISRMLTLEYGPWRSEDVERLLAEDRAEPPR
jgi:hypothetical protein